jgi:DNA-binding NtrC family response regulator
MVPPLAARRDDVPAIADAMLRRAARDLHLRPARLTAEAGAVLSNHPLTGNLHDLAAMASRIAALAPGEMIDPDRLADAIGLRQLSAPIAGRSLLQARRPTGCQIGAVLH